MGLRLQIILALGALMLLAFGPLFFAVASLTKATLLEANEQWAKALCDTIAAQAATAYAVDRTGQSVADVLRSHVAVRSGDASCFFAGDGRRVACAGTARDVEAIEPPRPETPLLRRLSSDGTPRRLEVISPAGGGALVARTDLRERLDHGPLVRLVALYMSVFALALLVFAYFALTRVIVRPIEQLVAAADRVAHGARTLHVPRSGARELVDLATTVHGMAHKLIAEEAALLLKVEELTETTARLTQAQSQLVRSERMASVGRLAAGLAHEIGNPLAALMGMHDLLLDGGLTADAQRDFLQRMRRETERIHKVVRDLLAFARPEQAVIGGEAEVAADVGAAVEDVIALVRHQRPFRDVHVETDVEAGLRVALSPSRLAQILLNLILNAGAAIAQQNQPGRVRVRAKPSGAGERVRIEIEDDGPGVDATVRDRLFEPFVTTKDVGEGTGLGLAVCRGLVEAAGGEIGLDSSYTTGARFYVALPAASS